MSRLVHRFEISLPNGSIYSVIENVDMVSARRQLSKDSMELIRLGIHEYNVKYFDGKVKTPNDVWKKFL